MNEVSHRREERLQAALKQLERLRLYLWLSGCRWWTTCYSTPWSSNGSSPLSLERTRPRFNSQASLPPRSRWNQRMAAPKPGKTWQNAGLAQDIVGVHDHQTMGPLDAPRDHSAPPCWTIITRPGRPLSSTDKSWRPLSENGELTNRKCDTAAVFARPF